MCVECDNHVNAHEGPVCGHEYEFLVREVAEALVGVGRGMTYTEAARRARRTADAARRDRDPYTDLPERPDHHGQTVAEWVGEFTTVVAARHADSEWPECLVLDSTRFQYMNTWTGRKRDLFSILAGWGYPAGHEKGRMWKVTAGPLGDGPAWAEFLASLPGRPRSVVCDKDEAILDGIRRAWGDEVPVHQCEHHLFVNARDALRSDVILYGDPVSELLKDALKSPAGWAAFRDAVLADTRARNTKRWVKAWDETLTVQTERRASLPPHYANGAIEEPLSRIRAAIDHRKFSLRNRARMNLLLELMRLSANRQDNWRVYAEDIRDWLASADPTRKRAYRGLYDPWGVSTASNPRTRVYSLWGTSEVEGAWRS